MLTLILNAIAVMLLLGVITAVIAAIVLAIDYLLDGEFDLLKPWL